MMSILVLGRVYEMSESAREFLFVAHFALKYVPFVPEAFCRRG